MTNQNAEVETFRAMWRIIANDFDAVSRLDDGKLVDEFDRTEERAVETLAKGISTGIAPPEFSHASAWKQRYADMGLDDAGAWGRAFALWRSYGTSLAALKHRNAFDADDSTLIDLRRASHPDGWLGSIGDLRSLAIAFKRICLLTEMNIDGPDWSNWMSYKCIAAGLGMTVNTLKDGDRGHKFRPFIARREKPAKGWGEFRLDMRCLTEIEKGDFLKSTAITRKSRGADKKKSEYQSGIKKPE